MSLLLTDARNCYGAATVRERALPRASLSPNLRWVAAFLLAAASAAFAAAPVPLACGQLATGNIDTGSQQFAYTISVAAGATPEIIMVRLISLGSGVLLAPNFISIVDQNGAQIARLPDKPEFGLKFPFFMFYSLPAGTYTMVLNFAGVGAYQLAYIPTNRSCNNPSLTCGQVVSGKIDVGQMQSYQFSANKGDPVSIFYLKTGGDAGFAPGILAFDSLGQPQPIKMPYIMPDGLLTLVLLESSGMLRFNYSLSLLDLKGPCNTTSISCGSALDGSISGPLGIGLYTINSGASDVYFLRLLTTDTSGGLQPSVQVYDPQGTAVQPSSIQPDGLQYGPLPAGQFLVTVSDSAGTGTGKYTLSLLRLNNGPCTGAQPLACGSVVNGQISGPLRTNIYTLSAQARDVYQFRLVNTSSGGSFTPQINVFGPDGTPVQTITPGAPAAAFSIPAAGTYSLYFSDASGVQNGSYSVWVTRLNNPCGSVTSLQCGTLVAGSISQSLQPGIYSYATNPGDSFTLRLLETGATSQASVQVFAPNTTGTAVQPLSTSTTEVVNSPGGPYTILVSNQSSNPQNDTFALEAINTRGGCGLSPPQGQSVSGLVSGPAPFTAYSFAAAQGEPLLVRVASFTPGFTANVDLYDPTGKRVGSNTFRLLNTASAAGNYTAIVSGSTARSTGSYAFFWKLLNQAVSTPLACGQTTPGALSSAAQFSAYNISANTGDLLKVLLTSLPGTTNAQMELFDPAGALLKTSAAEIDQKVSAGNYTLLVSPASSLASTGGFALALQRPNNPCSAAGLTCGQTVLQQVTAPGQLDAYTFTGSAGDQVAITVTPRVGNISPVTELYDASGNSLTSTPGTTSLNAVLSAAGQYTVTVHDKAGTNTGSYRVGLQHANTPCPEDDNQKPTITLVHPTGGEVIAGGSVYQIAWQSDDNVAVASHTIQLSTDGGKTFAALPGGPGSLSGVAQSYSWTVPPSIPPSRNAVIQVTATDKAGNAQAGASGPVTVIGSGFTPNENVTYTYDSLNRIVKATYQGGPTIQYVYDAAGNLVNVVEQ